MLIKLPIYEDIAWALTPMLNLDQLQGHIKAIRLYRDSSDWEWLLALYQFYAPVLKSYAGLMRERAKNIDFAIVKKEEYSKALAFCLSNLNQPTFLLSSSHATTYHTIRQINPDKQKKIVVFCFDAHIDMCSSERDIWKGNVFSKLLDEGYLQHVCFLSPYPHMKRENKQVSFIQKFDLKDDLAGRLEKLFQNNFENLYFSFDVDVLDTRAEYYTAMEYCPIHILTNFSSKQIFCKSRAAINRAVKRSYLIKNKLGYKNLYHMGENGWSAETLKQLAALLIKTSNKMSCKIGVPYQEGVVYGDFVEYFGVDYQDKTIKFIDGFVNFIERSVKNEGEISGKGSEVDVETCGL